MKLAQTQQRLWSAIAHGLEGGAAGAAAIVAAGANLSAERRVEIYARMYFWRQVDALREDFPKLAALLGEDAFSDLAAAYIATYPSEHPSLGRLGRKLATFLREHAAEETRPDLADLASLEWARAEVFVELDAPALPSNALAALAPDQFARSRLRLVPAVRLLTLRHDAIALWHCLENEEPVPEIAPKKLHALIWRKGWQVFHVELDAQEAQALRRILDGRPMSEICDAFAERADAERAAFGAIQSWFTEELIAGIDR
ncbi:MAG TPA: DNA-binding domain-containing protein [Myxococcaceae bacterium]|nr:DNA-binding domain-containing protein [Myxococcaceae bacterium]